MSGFRYSIDYYHNGGYIPAVVYSTVQPPCKAEIVILPDWIAQKFKENYRLHTVITDQSGNFIDENFRL